jgi:hypothetical protein
LSDAGDRSEFVARGIQTQPLDRRHPLSSGERPRECLERLNCAARGDGINRDAAAKAVGHVQRAIVPVEQDIRRECSGRRRRNHGQVAVLDREHLHLLGVLIDHRQQTIPGKSQLGRARHGNLRAQPKRSGRLNRQQLHFRRGQVLQLHEPEELTFRIGSESERRKRKPGSRSGYRCQVAGLHAESTYKLRRILDVEEFARGWRWPHEGTSSASASEGEQSQQLAGHHGQLRWCKNPSPNV